MKDTFWQGAKELAEVRIDWLSLNRVREAEARVHQRMRIDSMGCAAGYEATSGGIEKK